MARAALDTGAVVDAAARLADEHGLGELTLAGVAADLGVRPPSLYAHVRGLGDLRARLAARAAEQLERELAQATAGRSGRDAVKALCDAYRRYALAHRGSYEALQGADLLGAGAGARAGRGVVEVVLAVLRGFALEGERAVHATRAVRAAVHGFVTLEAAGGFGMELSTEESFRRLVLVLESGIEELAAG